MRKRMLSLLLALCMVSALLPALSAPAHAAEPWLWPLDGIYSMSRGYSSEHRGLDILSDSVLGMQVRASKSGTVVYRADSCPHTNYVQDTNDCCDGTGGCNDGAGNYIVIRNDDGTYCRYLHLQQGTSAALDTHVNQGDYVGRVGSSGRSMLPHLHFEIMTGPDASTDRINANPTDPRHSYTYPGPFEPAVSYVYETDGAVKGRLESCTASVGKIHVYGWAFDPADPSASAQVRVYIGKSAKGRVVEAGRSRKDVNETWGIGGKHGFSAALKTSLSGKQKVSVYAIMPDGTDSETPLGVVTVTIPKETPGGKNPFKDVKKSAYYYEPVLWAVNRKPQITKGTSETTFRPAAECTRAQVVTFLWRAAGEPTPMSSKNPFSDVKKGAYYYKAVLWATEQGITNGKDLTHFAPNAPCTRAQVVTFLYRSAHSPKLKNTDNPFRDVKNTAYYHQAVLWAVSEEITKGTDKTRFSPSKSCTRGQIVTFLYRDLH